MDHFIYIYIYIYIIYICSYKLLERKKTTNKLQVHPLKSELLTKQACRDELVVYSLFFFFSNNLYFALLICIEHFFTNIELYTLYMQLYIYRQNIRAYANNELTAEGSKGCNTTT